MTVDQFLVQATVAAIRAGNNGSTSALIALQAARTLVQDGPVQFEKSDLFKALQAIK